MPSKTSTDHTAQNNRRDFTIVGIGELLWDEFGDARLPGGAPANVAFQAMQLGANGIVCSRVGDDLAGDELCEFLAAQQLSTAFIQRDSTRHTGRVTVTQPDNPQYIIHENAAWDAIEIDPTVDELLQQADAICFGTLAQRASGSQSTIQHAMRHCREQCLKVFDVNLRTPWYSREIIETSLQHANIFKLNADEVTTLNELLELPTADSINTKSTDERDEFFCRTIRERFDVSRICITRAEDGCLLNDAQQTVTVDGATVTIADTVGAGDAFTAALIIASLENRPLKQTAQFANGIGARTTERPGAMSSCRNEFAEIRKRFLQ